MQADLDVVAVVLARDGAAVVAVAGLAQVRSAADGVVAGAAA